MARGTELVRLQAKLGDTEIQFSGAKYFYSKLGKTVGVTPLNDRANQRTGRRGAVLKGEEAKRNLVKLVAVMSGQIAGGVGTNQAQDESTRRFTFYANPSNVDAAMTELIGKNVDPGLGLGSMKIIDVYRPLVRAYR